MRILTGDVMGFPPDHDVRHDLDGRVVSSMHQPHLTTQGIPWYSFLFEAEKDPRATECGQRGHPTSVLGTEPESSNVPSQCPNLVISHNTIY